MQYEIADECRELSVPTFVLRSLVKNALRHGMGPGRKHVQLEIGARLDDAGRLRLWIADDGLGLAPGFATERHAGTDLGNTRARLQRLYGPDAQLDVRARREGAVIADVLLPASRATTPVKATA